MTRFPLNLFVNSGGRPARLNARTHRRFERAAKLIVRKPGDPTDLVNDAAQQLQLDAQDLAFIVDVQRSLIRASTSSRRAAA